MFKHDLRQGDTIQIGEAVIRLVRCKTGQIASLLIDAPASVKITCNNERKEQKEAEKGSNR